MSRNEERTIWEDRYRELEKTLEAIVRNAGTAMRSLESRGEESFKLRKIVQHDALGEDYLTCVADGSNLEYAFTFSRGDSRLFSIKYQRSNSVPLAEARHRGADHCVVTVKTNKPSCSGNTLTAKVRI